MQRAKTELELKAGSELEPGLNTEGPEVQPPPTPKQPENRLLHLVAFSKVRMISISCAALGKFLSMSGLTPFLFQLKTNNKVGFFSDRFVPTFSLHVCLNE